MQVELKVGCELKWAKVGPCQELLVADHSSVIPLFFAINIFSASFAPISNDATMVEDKTNLKIKTPW